MAKAKLNFSKKFLKLQLEFSFIFGLEKVRVQFLIMMDGWWWWIVGVEKMN